MNTFGQLTGLDVTIAPDVQGTVTMNFKDVPWDEALGMILRQHGCTFSLEGNKMHIFKAP